MIVKLLFLIFVLLLYFLIKKILIKIYSIKLIKKIKNNINLN